MSLCMHPGPQVGDIIGKRCPNCQHVVIVHDDRGCVVCALWDSVDRRVALDRR